MNGSGVDILGVGSELVAEGCDFRGNAGSGVYVVQGARLQATLCRFKANRHNGLNVRDKAGRAVLRQCHFSCNLRDAVQTRAHADDCVSAVGVERSAERPAVPGAQDASGTSEAEQSFRTRFNSGNSGSDGSHNDWHFREAFESRPEFEQVVRTHAESVRARAARGTSRVSGAPRTSGN